MTPSERDDSPGLVPARLWLRKSVLQIMREHGIKHRSFRNPPLSLYYHFAQEKYIGNTRRFYVQGL